MTLRKLQIELLLATVRMTILRVLCFYIKNAKVNEVKVEKSLPNLDHMYVLSEFMFEPP